MRSAAWRISLRATCAFACGTTLVFVFLHNFVAEDIQRRSDAWLSGEVEVLGDVAERTPRDALYGRVVKEVAELASKEVPNKVRSDLSQNDSVFFLQADRTGLLELWVGAGDGVENWQAIQRSHIAPNAPSDLRVMGFDAPFRIASIRMDDGSRIYLGLSERDQLRVLKNLRLRFFVLSLFIILLGFTIVFYSTRRTLGHVQGITEAASRIGQSDLARRVPTTRRNDEIGHLAITLNRMLERIENAMHQLHTITDSLAHDLRSPLTAIRGKLEISLYASDRTEQTERIVSAMDELDRLAEFLNKSLDVAEAQAGALRLDKREIDLDNLLRVMIDLYEPSMSEKGLQLQLRSAGPVSISGDAGLIHRMISNLFDNEVKHLPACCRVTVLLQADSQSALLEFEDDGPGFASEIESRQFEHRVRGNHSGGRGLGLAFVEAVTRAHGGSVTASNREQGGARLRISLPLAAQAAPQATSEEAVSAS